MPPLQRHLPSAWDRGGLLGPRGNARFLEVDGLRVKYIGKEVGRKKETGDVHFCRASKCCHAGIFFLA